MKENADFQEGISKVQSTVAPKIPINKVWA